jgi:hypothetical protein
MPAHANALKAIGGEIRGDRHLCFAPYLHGSLPCCQPVEERQKNPRKNCIDCIVHACGAHDPSSDSCVSRTIDKNTYLKERNMREKKIFDRTICFTVFREWVETIQYMAETDPQQALDAFLVLSNFCLYGEEPDAESNPLGRRLACSQRRSTEEH